MPLLTQAAIRDFEVGMQLCIVTAVEEFGFTSLTVTPHLDNRDAGDGECELLKHLAFFVLFLPFK
jgi:hypothetical protein